MKRPLIASMAVLIAILGTGAALAAWKQSSIAQSEKRAASQPEPAETITIAEAKAVQHRSTTTSIGTVIALRSITLKNELSGTVSDVNLAPGAIVDQGAVLLTLDTSVERAEIAEQQARADLARTVLDRLQNANQNRAVPEIEIDRARGELDVAIAQIARTNAVIERKTIRAPFRARVGISDIHRGQYLAEGTTLTTLQGVGDAVYVDFAAAQHIVSGLRRGDTVEILPAGATTSAAANIIAVDARIDPSTRNAIVRAKLPHASNAPAPGASVRVRIPAGAPVAAVSVPILSLRKSPAGDHVFVIEDTDGKTRARMQRVTSGSVLADQVLILQGLSAGQRVAAAGSFKLRDQALVSVAER